MAIIRPGRWTPQEKIQYGIEYYKKGSYQAAYTLFLSAAETGLPDAQYYVAQLYASGRGVQEDKKQALLWLHKAADQGHEKAIAALEKVSSSRDNPKVLFRRGVASYDSGEYGRAAEFFRRAAEQGYCDAQLNLGVMYKTGTGVPQSDDEAEKWFRQAADQGNSDAIELLKKLEAKKNAQPDPQELLDQGVAHYRAKQYPQAADYFRQASELGSRVAQFNLGLLYRKGEGVPKSDAEAAKWYQMAAQQGSCNAQFNLALLYRKGEGVPQSDSEAAKWYRMAAEQNDSAAQFNLGLMYENGEGVPKSCAEAARWYQKAAEQGHCRAQYNLGMLYKLGEGVPKSDTEAAKWFRKAAEQGDSEAQHILGLYCAVGAGIPEDAAEAADWFRKAAEQGHTEAMVDLGDVYRLGSGVPVDYAEAGKWYKKAADLGDSSAMRSMGDMYLYGYGIPENYPEAGKWYRKAIEHGNNGAQRFLSIVIDDLLDKGDDCCETWQDAEAAEYYRKAADLGSPVAQYYLGMMYEGGEGVPQSSTEAANWYRLSARQGYEDAIEALEKLEAEAKEPSPEELFQQGIARFQARDFAGALGNLTQAAKAGIPEAMYCLGLMCEQGYGVSPDKTRAQALYRLAAEHGLEKAQQHITPSEPPKPAAKPEKTYDPPLSEVERLLQDAVAAERSGDLAQALELFKAAGDLHHGHAAFIAANMYLLPELLDYEQAEIWADKALREGYSEAEDLLVRIWSQAGSHYMVKSEEIKETFISEHYGEMDFDTLFRKAKELPDMNQCLSLSLQYYTKAAEQDDTWSMVFLAHYYYWKAWFGEISDVDTWKQTAEWIERAEELGDHWASELKSIICKWCYFRIGMAYGSNEERKALTYFRKAAELGDEPAMYNAAVALYNLSKDRSSLQEALKWATEAQNRGNKNAAALIHSIKSWL